MLTVFFSVKKNIDPDGIRIGFMGIIGKSASYTIMRTVEFFNQHMSFKNSFNSAHDRVSITIAYQLSIQ